ncbi:hypothetical protein [Bradyrhizobium sp. SZCCHNR1051]|uniref:hypothetical protein n=1 Tax=Bradyrhizobium sp. SZCCHNR1051 TaxID=3057355 RepID=UPI0029163EDC|nr:hypothetical protein [Bradyrhizobium sp. SZCCHNR1051]
MAFVELNRSFVPLSKDSEPSLDIGPVWGRKVGGWLDWKDLREHRRVVLLAEASSGKSEEFKHQVERLTEEGKAAFYLPIEELADQGFESALDANAARQFERWSNSTDEAWFFFDSIDEARLNRKNFAGALKRFAREVGAGVERARVLISCRVTDWKGLEDRETIGQWLPAFETANSLTEGDESALLDPLFDKKQTSTRKKGAEKTPNELLVVQLVPLSAEQYRALAKKAGATNLDAFIAGIDRNGLEAFAERPGDLLDLAEYWKTHKQFGSFAEMAEHGITRKLRERDTHRADNETLSLAKSREGAARLAAALTFGKSFTLRAPNHDPDPSLAIGALDALLILNDWNEAQCNAILRRGVFAPATYGRIRFHHRSTQEYLTAKWLDRLISAKCPISEIWQILFVDRYGVETVVPSLRPAAAWLSLWHPSIRDEIIRREPLVLLRHGDPGSLSLDARKRILTVYAAKHKAAEIADDSLDWRALWSFSHQDLADTVAAVWKANDRVEFRFDMLRLIRDGSIRGCANISRVVALDNTAPDYHRIVALQALEACGEQEALATASRELMKSCANASATLASAFAQVLYPRNLSLEDLLRLIDLSKPAGRSTADGFAHNVQQLYNAAPNKAERSALAFGLGELCLQPPFADSHCRISKRHYELARHLDVLAAREIAILGDTAPPPGLVKLLMAVERCDSRSHIGDDDAPNLRELVQKRSKLNLTLFCSDLEEQRANSRIERKPLRYWQVGLGLGQILWEFTQVDLPALYSELSTRFMEDDKRVIFSAIIHVLTRGAKLQSEAENLRNIVAASSVLLEDLEGYLNPPAEDPEEVSWKREAKARQRKCDRQTAEDKASWVRFKDQLRDNPSLLSDPKNLTSWQAGIHRLWDLTRWLQARTQGAEPAAGRQWRLLKEGFGREVAQAYRDGMKMAWRNISPERPKRTPDSGITTKYITVLAFTGVGIEAAEDVEWVNRLTDDEALRAARHGCESGQGYPDWIDALAMAHPNIVLPVLEQEIALEWSAAANGGTDFLSRYGAPATSLQQPIQGMLLDQFLKTEAPSIEALAQSSRIVRNFQFVEADKQRILRVARRRFTRHVAACANDFALNYLALLLLVDPDSGANDLVAWLDSPAPNDRRARAEYTLGKLFDRHDSLVGGALSRASVATLEKLLRAAYSHIRAEHDVVHEGSYSPNARDHAQSARNTILSALLDRPGADAYRAMLRIAQDPNFAIRSERFRELARGKAERDAEHPAWTATEVVAFGDKRIAPVKTGDDLLRLVLGVLRDIVLKFSKGDSTSRQLLERAKDEEEVQQWLTEQLQLRSLGRYHAYREAEVAKRDRPDIIVASTTSQCEVAIEVKHGGKLWTASQLEDALRTQLAVDYLKPETRRHGVLVVTHHRDRKWLDPATRKPLTFEALIDWLSGIASTLVEIDGNAVEVRCVGINAWCGVPLLAKKEDSPKKFAKKQAGA